MIDTILNNTKNQYQAIATLIAHKYKKHLRNFLQTEPFQFY